MSLRRSSVTAKTIIWTSTPIRGATIQQQNAIRLRRLEKPTFTAMTPKRLLFFRRKQDRKQSQSSALATKSTRGWRQTVKRKSQWHKPQTKKTTRHAHKTLCLSRKNVSSKKQRFENATHSSATFPPKIIVKIWSKSPSTPSANRQTIWPWSEHDPSMKQLLRNPPVCGSQKIWLSCSGYLSKNAFRARPPQKMKALDLNMQDFHEASSKNDSYY